MQLLVRAFRKEKVWGGCTRNFLEKRKEEKRVRAIVHAFWVIKNNNNKRRNARTIAHTCVSEAHVGRKGAPATQKGVQVWRKGCRRVERGASDSRGVSMGGNEVLVGLYGVLVGRTCARGWSKRRVGVRSPGLRWAVSVVKRLLRVRGLT